MLKAPNRNKHFRVRVQDGIYEIGQQRFSSLDELIEHYKKHPIFKQENEKLYLIKPFSFPSPSSSDNFWFHLIIYVQLQLSLVVCASLALCCNHVICDDEIVMVISYKYDWLFVFGSLGFGENKGLGIVCLWVSIAHSRHSVSFQLTKFMSPSLWHNIVICVTRIKVVLLRKTYCKGYLVCW